MIKISGVETTGKLQQWNALLEEWCLLIERYSRAFEGEEHIFDYNERPNTGVLASAAWRCGLLALEEFGHGKYAGKEQYSHGRCDLWIASEDVVHQWYVEAKHCYTSINTRDIINAVKPKLEYAMHDATRSAYFDGGVGVGVCFVSIYDQSKNIDERTDNIQGLLEELQSIQSELEYDAIAWTFPKEARQYQPDNQQYSRLGIVMIAKRYDYEA